MVYLNNDLLEQITSGCGILFSHFRSSVSGGSTLDKDQVLLEPNVQEKNTPPIGFLYPPLGAPPIAPTATRTCFISTTKAEKPPTRASKLLYLLCPPTPALPSVGRH